jgi:hypothetical protein
MPTRGLRDRESVTTPSRRRVILRDAPKCERAAVRANGPRLFEK